MSLLFCYDRLIIEQKGGITCFNNLRKKTLPKQD